MSSQLVRTSIFWRCARFRRPGHPNSHMNHGNPHDLVSFFWCALWEIRLGPEVSCRKLLDGILVVTQVLPSSPVVCHQWCHYARMTRTNRGEYKIFTQRPLRSASSGTSARDAAATGAAVTSSSSSARAPSAARRVAIATSIAQWVSPVPPYKMFGTAKPVRIQLELHRTNSNSRCNTT